MIELIRKIIALFKSPITPYKEGGVSGEIPSPRADIDWDDVDYSIVTKTLSIKNIEPPIWIVTVALSNSMEPTLDDYHFIVLSSNPKYLSEAELEIGDVVVWEKDNRSVIHSIVNISEDVGGRYYTTRGWNVSFADPYKIRIEDIKWVGLINIWAKQKDIDWWKLTKVYR